MTPMGMDSDYSRSVRDEQKRADAASPFGYCDRTGCDRPVTKFHSVHGSERRDAWCRDGHRQMDAEDHEHYDAHLGKTVDTIQHRSVEHDGDHDLLVITFTDGTYLSLMSGDSSGYQSCIRETE